MGQTNSAKNLDLELTNMRRNPYLADYAEYKRVRGPVRSDSGQIVRSTSRKNITIDMHKASKEAEARRRTAAVKRRRQLFRRKMLLAGCMIAVFLGAVLGLWNFSEESALGSGETVKAAGEQDRPLFDDLLGKKVQGIGASAFGKHPTWTEDFLTPNEYSRPGEPLEEVNSIFVHYTANKGTSAAQNRSYFEQLKDTHETSASAHFIIGYEGEIIQCIPLDEIAYAVQTRNYDSISIECCYLEGDGSFTRETYDSLLSLLRWLMETYDLDKDDILRHYDCGGKKCPLYYTDNPEEWERLKREL